MCSINFTARYSELENFGLVNSGRTENQWVSYNIKISNGMVGLVTYRYNSPWKFYKWTPLNAKNSQQQNTALFHLAKIEKLGFGNMAAVLKLNLINLIKYLHFS